MIEGEINEWLTNEQKHLNLMCDTGSQTRDRRLNLIETCHEPVHPARVSAHRLAGKIPPRSPGISAFFHVVIFH